MRALMVCMLVVAIVFAGCGSTSDSPNSGGSDCIAADPYYGGAPDCGPSDAAGDEIWSDYQGEREGEMRARAEHDAYCERNYTPEICGP
jgi:hypothetical protein